MSQGTWKTTGSGPSVKTVCWIAAIGGITALGVIAAKSAAATFGNIAATSVTATASLVAGVCVTLLVRWIRGRGRNSEPAQPGQPVSLLRTNPNALPPREPRAIAPQTVVNVNLGDALTALLREQAAPAWRVTAETVEQQQEIQR